MREDHEDETMRGQWRYFLAAAVIAALLVVVSAGGFPSGESSDDRPSGDSSARLACSHFRNVASDASNGLLTLSEMRSKLAEVHDDASVSEVTAVQVAARDLLAAYTQGEDPTAAINAMGDACRSIDA